MMPRRSISLSNSVPLSPIPPVARVPCAYVPGPMARKPARTPARHHGISTFQAEQVGDRCFGWRVLRPTFDRGIQLGDGFDLRQLALLLHEAIPRQLPLRLGPGLFWRMPAAQRVPRLDVTTDQGRYAEAHTAFAHFRQTDRPVATPVPIGLPPLEGADFMRGPRVVTIPLQRVHA
ncbi:MAG: hypothetical protein ACI9TH_000161 [Kiritimatiellia bacterium]|jgi:hypothetical protein